jgi:hypothetical protein
MIKVSLTRLAVAVGGLALSLTAGAGVASADPDLGPIINTTCTYPQAVAALNAQDPATAAQFNAADGPAVGGLAVPWSYPTGRRHLQQLLSGLGTTFLLSPIPVPAPATARSPCAPISSDSGSEPVDDS